MQPWLFSIIVLMVSFGLNWGVKQVIERLGESKGVPEKRSRQVYKYFRFILGMMTFIALLMVWGVDYKGLAVLATSVLAMLAVALVAQWSILSNITSGVLIFFTFPARIGHTIEIMDGNNSIRGEIQEITLFQVILKDKKGELVSYPNSLLLQKAVRIVEKKDNEKKKSPRFFERMQNKR